MTLSEHPNDELEETFEHFDEDDDGSIDREEFADVMDALGADMSPDELDVGFDIIDEDGNGEIEYDEFADWWSDR
jgi:Ca2+-binding EF-hand superfamily protein